MGVLKGNPKSEPKSNQKKLPEVSCIHECRSYTPEQGRAKGLSKDERKHDESSSC